MFSVCAQLQLGIGGDAVGRDHTNCKKAREPKKGKKLKCKKKIKKKNRLWGTVGQGFVVRDCDTFFKLACATYVPFHFYDN